MKDGIKRNHESFGMVEFSRTQHSHPQTLFGSSMGHRSTITMTLKEAEEERHLYQYRRYGRKNLIKVEMSPTQFSDAITSMNIGDGVPVTIRYVDGDNYKREDPPSANTRNEFKEEANLKFKKLIEKLKELSVDASKLRKASGVMKVSEKKILCDRIERICREVIHNIPFIQKQFVYQMNQTVKEAKGEIDGFIQSMVSSLGIQAIKDQFPVLLDTIDIEKEIQIE